MLGEIISGLYTRAARRAMCTWEAAEDGCCASSPEGLGEKGGDAPSSKSEYVVDQVKKVLQEILFGLPNIRSLKEYLL
jgi:hypothetical protein